LAALGLFGVAIALCVAVLIRVTITGDDAPPPMIFITLTYIFLGIAFITAGRSRTFPWFPHR
jgi:hypothetical protein